MTGTWAERIDAAAQLLHERRHRWGSAPVCGPCRSEVLAIADVLMPRDRTATVEEFIAAYYTPELLSGPD